MRVRRWLLLGVLCLVSAAAVERSLEEVEAARERVASTMMHVNGSFVRYALAGTQRERQLVVLLNGFNGATLDPRGTRRDCAHAPQNHRSPQCVAKYVTQIRMP